MACPIPELPPVTMAVSPLESPHDRSFKIVARFRWTGPSYTPDRYCASEGTDGIGRPDRRCPG